MEKYIFDNKQQLSQAAADKAEALLTSIISTKGRAVFVAATGTSQFDFLDILIKKGTVDWSKTVMFHLDEYIGLPEQHPASFRKYLKERLISQVRPGAVNLINGEHEDPGSECARLNRLISRETIDVGFVGVGENGHLAFNDPPADFETEEPFIVVDLDEPCRQQQLGEGWFKTLDEVPKQAISMSMRQIMKSRAIICIAPEKRKARAIKNCLENEISNLYPASILRQHPQAFLYLDRDSASLLKR